MKTKPTIFSIALATCIFGPLSPASAGTATPVIEMPAKSSLWEFVIEPYGWMTGLDGTAGVLGRTLNVDVPFHDVLSHLDWAAYLTGEVRHGRWGIIFDGYIAQLSDVADPSAPTVVNVDGVLKQALVEVDLAYRLAEGPRGYVDAYVGGRYNRINVDITTVLTTALVPVLVTASSDTKQWADPLIGVRGQYNFNEKWFTRGRLDIGGFNLVSNVTFQGSVSAGYNFNAHLFAELGYRYLLTEYESGGFSYNLAASGMFIGLGIKF
jgi:hypothetical protein